MGNQGTPGRTRRAAAIVAVVALVAGFASVLGAGVARADNVPTVTVSDVTQQEGDSGTSAFVFAVALTQASRVPVSVRASTRDATAVEIGRASCRERV